jgi:steroid delta-isomerase
MNIHSASPFSRYVKLIGELRPETIDELGTLITEDVHFRDPFNDTRGKDAYLHIMRHMFAILTDIRFDIHEQAGDGKQRFLWWTFTARHSMIGAMKVDGITRVELAEDGRIAAHIDYWDSDSAFMTKIPVAGLFIKALRSQMAIKT